MDLALLYLSNICSYTCVIIFGADCSKEEFNERLETLEIKKNLYLNGFKGPIEMMWTQQAYDEQNNTQKQN